MVTARLQQKSNLARWSFSTLRVVTIGSAGLFILILLLVGCQQKSYTKPDPEIKRKVIETLLVRWRVREYDRRWAEDPNFRKMELTKYD